VTVKKPGIAGTVKSLVRPERKDFHAVDDISFQIAEGEFTAFLGPNGAGKTTTIKILTGILNLTSGDVSVLGHDPFKRDNELRRSIALVMGNKQQLWWDLPAWESFVVLKELYGVDEQSFKKRIDALVPALSIEDKLHTQVRKMSLGERMKCELVAALLHSPRVVFLDEPTIGLDVVSQQRIRAFLKDYQKETGCTVVLTSHYMQDVAELCRRVLLIDKGHLVYDGQIEDLAKAHASEKRLRLTFTEPIEEVEIAAFGDIVEFSGSNTVLTMPKADSAQKIGQILQNLPVLDITVEEPSVEEIISELMSGTGPPVSRET
jgi:ABC-2 type transport system ATP-binding protein